MHREALEPVLPALDPQELLARCLGNLDFVERVLAKFESRFDADLEALAAAVRSDDSDQITLIAHRIKGASANVAAHGLRQKAAGIEQLARQQALTEIPAQLEQLRTEWGRFAQSVATFRGEPQSTSL